MSASRRCRVGGLCGVVLLAWVTPAAAQQRSDQTAAAAAPAPPVVQTLEEVRALPPDQEEVLDLYRFNNPIQVEPNAFDKAWSPPPSPKEISEHGGYIAYGLDMLVGAAAKGLKKIPGVRGQIQPAVARPPPLNLEQIDRAARIGAGGTPDSAATLEHAAP